MFDAVGEVGVGDVEDAVAKLAACESRPDLARLHAVMNRLDALWLRTIEEYDRSGDWADEGFVSPASAIRTHCSIDQGAANHALGLARKLRQLPVLAETFAAGEISRGHVLAIASAATPGRPEFAGFEEPLTALATLTTPKGLAEKVREITDALDGDGGAERFHEQYERRRFHLSQTMDGMWRGDFLVDPEAGATMQQIVQTVGGPQPKGDDPSAAQFRADALSTCSAWPGSTRNRSPGCANRAPTSPPCSPSRRSNGALQRSR